MEHTSEKKKFRDQKFKLFELQGILTTFTLCLFYCLATGELKPQMKIPYVITILTSYFSSWENWKH